MSFKLNCWIVLVSVVCVVLAEQEVSKNFYEENESDNNNTLVDEVLFRQTECDCGVEATNCDWKEGQKVCTCRDGYVPAGPDVICTQKCNSTKLCENGGICLQNVCKCLNGTSGHLCKTIDDCSSICGTADCGYNVTSRDVYCKCRKGYAFDYTTKMCRYCGCGTYERSCSFVEGKKKCNCMDAYADRLGNCEFCFCKGYSNMYGCHFNSVGDMKCNCMRGFAQLKDECKKCDCGVHGNCSLWGWNSKSCKCENGYSEKYGLCEECDCGENGSCYFSNGNKICGCKKGFEEYQGKCRECDCGDFSRCEFSILGAKKCSCIESYGLHGVVCAPCNCDPGTSCIFKDIFDKECICPDGYANSNGKCRECDCKMEGSNCTIENGLRYCHCPEGFESNKDRLINPTCTDKNECLWPDDNDCPPISTKCVNTWGSYTCVCGDGFEEIYTYGNDIKRDGCRDIDECTDWSACFDSHARCVNTPGSYRCDCRVGYYKKTSAYKEKYNSCIEEARPWRVASIVLGCLFGVVILVLLIAICNQN